MLNRFQDVFRCLRHHDVRYVVIGGVAAILHGVPSATVDLDILIDATPDNAKRLLDALLDARLGTAGLTSAAAILANEITIFNDRVRLDVQTSTAGLDFDRAWSDKEIRTYHGQQFYLVSLTDLIASKAAAARPIDHEDVRLLTLSPRETDP